MESDLQNQRIGSNFVSDVKRGQSTSETSKMTLPEKSVVSTSSEPTTADTTYTHRTAPRPRSIPPSPHDDDRTPRVRPRFSPPAARVHTGPRFSRRRDVPHRRRDAHACRPGHHRHEPRQDPGRHHAQSRTRARGRVVPRARPRQPTGAVQEGAGCRRSTWRARP